MSTDREVADAVGRLMCAVGFKPHLAVAHIDTVTEAIIDALKNGGIRWVEVTASGHGGHEPVVHSPKLARLERRLVQRRKAG